VRILLVNYEYPPIGAGAANATMFVARALVELGHEVSVVTTAFGQLRGAIEEDGIHVHRLDARRASVDRSNLKEMASFLLAALGKVQQVARERRIEGTIAFFTLPCGPIGWRLKRSLGIPYIISLRGGDVPGLVPELNAAHRLLAPVRRAVLRCAMAVVANSESLARLSQSSDPVPVRVIPNGVDATHFAPGTRAFDAPAEPYAILFVGRLTLQKNLSLVLKTFGRISSERRLRVRLHVVGDGPLRAELERLASEVCASGDVIWHGWLPKRELAALYRTSDVFVNPSLYEGMPNTVLEAMASGLPVVASNIGGNDSLVKHGLTGFLFDFADEAGFGRMLCRLIDDPALGRCMGKAGREKAVSSFSWHAVARQYVELFAATASSPA
jgi:glycosyltransferase involved in cell wall biosynthesis